MEIEGALGCLGRLYDVVHGRSVIALFGEQGSGNIDNGLAAIGGAQPCAGHVCMPVECAPAVALLCCFLYEKQVLAAILTGGDQFIASLLAKRFEVLDGARICCCNFQHFTTGESGYGFLGAQNR